MKTIKEQLIEILGTSPTVIDVEARAETVGKLVCEFVGWEVWGEYNHLSGYINSYGYQTEIELKFLVNNASLEAVYFLESAVIEKVGEGLYCKALTLYVNVTPEITFADFQKALRWLFSKEAQGDQYDLEVSDLIKFATANAKTRLTAMCLAIINDKKSN